MKIGYKFIKKDMKSQNGDHTWKVGEWYKREKAEIFLWEKGFHACKEPLESLEHIFGDRWFIVEYRGKILENKGDKFFSQEMRLVREIPINNIVKRFAIFCAKQYLKNYEKEHPNDKRVYNAIEGAELYLDGKINLQELNKRISVAESAVRSATWSAARYSARSAVRSAYCSAESAESAAWYAASSADYSAESAYCSAKFVRSDDWSVETAAWSAAKNKQNKYLKKLIELELATPENIIKLKKDEIFIFGSNLAGRHGAGAAKLAKDKFGAKYGIGEGLTGRCYAFPSLDKDLNKRTTKELKESVKKLIKCAEENSDKLFYLTKVGCGLGGYKEDSIKKLFKNLPLNIAKPIGW